MTVEDFTRRRFFKAMAGAVAAFRAAGLLARTPTMPKPELKAWLPNPAVTNPKPIHMGWYMEKPVSMSVVNPKRPTLVHDPDIVKLNPLHRNDFQTERLCAYIRQRQQDQITYYRILNNYYEAEVHGER